MTTSVFAPFTVEPSYCVVGIAFTVTDGTIENNPGTTPLVVLNGDNTFTFYETDPVLKSTTWFVQLNALDKNGDFTGPGNQPHNWSFELFVDDVCLHTSMNIYSSIFKSEPIVY